MGCSDHLPLLVSFEIPVICQEVKVSKRDVNGRGITSSDGVTIILLLLSG